MKVYDDRTSTIGILKEIPTAIHDPIGDLQEGLDIFNSEIKQLQEGEDSINSEIKQLHDELDATIQWLSEVARSVDRLDDRFDTRLEILNEKMDASINSLDNQIQALQVFCVNAIRIGAILLGFTLLLAIVSLVC